MKLHLNVLLILMNHPTKAPGLCIIHALLTWISVQVKYLFSLPCFHDLTQKMLIFFPSGQTPILNRTFGLEVLPQRTRKQGREKTEKVWGGGEEKIFGKNIQPWNWIRSFFIGRNQRVLRVRSLYRQRFFPVFYKVLF